MPNVQDYRSKHGSVQVEVTDISGKAGHRNFEDLTALISTVSKVFVDMLNGKDGESAGEVVIEFGVVSTMENSFAISSDRTVATFAVSMKISPEREMDPL